MPICHLKWFAGDVSVVPVQSIWILRILFNAKMSFTSSHDVKGIESKSYRKKNNWKIGKRYNTDPLSKSITSITMKFAVWNTITIITAICKDVLYRNLMFFWYHISQFIIDIYLMHNSESWDSIFLIVILNLPLIS